jgi:Zn-dependent protease
VHAERLTELGARAEEAERAGRTGEALESWRDALVLLPPGSRQHARITERIRTLGEAAPRRGERAPGRRPGAGTLAAVGGLGLLLWKLKSALAFVSTKGKLLLGGLTKASTFFSMLLSFGVYWSVFGWKFAALLVLSLYVHEMGHVASLRRHGIRASAPAFIPGLGALVRLEQRPATAREDAEVGLAGPEWGLAAALACWGVHLATGSGAWAAAARIGAWINLFNLLPVWQLDGARGFAALTRPMRFAVAAALGGAWLVVQDGLLLLLALVAAGRAALSSPASAEEAEPRILLRFLVLVAALSALCLIEVPLPG